MVYVSRQFGLILHRNVMLKSDQIMQIIIWHLDNPNKTMIFSQFYFAQWAKFYIEFCVQGRRERGKFNKIIFTEAQDWMGAQKQGRREGVKGMTVSRGPVLKRGPGDHEIKRKT